MFVQNFNIFLYFLPFAFLVSLSSVKGVPLPNNRVAQLDDNPPGLLHREMNTEQPVVEPGGLHSVDEGGMPEYRNRLERRTRPSRSGGGGGSHVNGYSSFSPHIAAHLSCRRRLLRLLVKMPQI